LNSISPVPKQGEQLFSGIKNLTNDNSYINIPSPIIDNNNEVENKSGLWNKLFGRN
jgi:hypothetical protein